MQQPNYQPGFPHDPQQGAHYAQPSQGPMMGPMYAPHAGAYSTRPGASGFLGNDRFLKGLLIGAAAAYLLTNESVQRTAIKGAVKVWSLLQGGVEEVKERFQDAEAELRAEAGE